MEKKDNKTKSKFHWKSFISIGLALSGVWLTVNSIILYLAPPGRVAKWVNWKIMGLDKDQWAEQHIIFGFLAIIFIVFHLFTLNWKVFLSYFRKLKTGVTRTKEIILTILLFVIIFYGTHYRIEPLNSILVYGEYLTESWEVESDKAPVSHAEELSLNELSKNYKNKTAEDLLKILSDKGIKVNSLDEILKDIGKNNNNIAPIEIFNLLELREKEEKKVDPNDLFKQGSGMGRKTFSEVCEVLGKSPADVAEKLKANNVIVSDFNEKIKDIASDAEISPIDLAKMMNEE